MLQAAMPMPPTVDQFMKVIMAYDGGSGEPNVVSGGGDVVDGGDGGDGGRDPYGTVFDDIYTLCQTGNMGPPFACLLVCSCVL